MEPLPRTHSCFVCGIGNPLGLRLGFESDRRIAQVRLRFRPEHVGFRETVHGGLLATVLDELMVWGCAVITHRLAYCAEMTVRYLRPVTPGIPVIGLGELVENRRGKLFLARGELRDETGQVLAESTGKYLAIPGEPSAEMLADFVEDPRVWFGPMAGQGASIPGGSPP